MDNNKSTDKTKMTAQVAKQSATQVAALKEVYPGHPYLMVEDGRGGVSEGGNQNWWSRKTKITGHKGMADGLKKKMGDRSYRLWKGGCGVIALCDLELYLMKLQERERHQNIACDSYMSYVEKRYASRYVLWANPVDCMTGLQPWKMIYGFWRFVREGEHPYKRAVWAKHCLKPGKWQKKAVLSDIERMLSENIPVVFSCHRFGKKHDTGLYRTLEEAGNGKPPETVNGHYMTVISLHKSPTFEGKYILKVISWGKIYYIDYDEYARGLNFFHNILTVKMK